MSNTNSFGTPKPNGLDIPADGELNPLLVQRVKNMIINKMMEDQKPNRYIAHTVTVGDITITCTNHLGWSKPQVYVTSATSAAQVVNTIPAASFDDSRTKTDKFETDTDKNMNKKKKKNKNKKNKNRNKKKNERNKNKNKNKNKTGES